jgi:hypothetical protein
MNNRIIKIEPTANTVAQLAKGVKIEGSRIWAGRVAAQASLISKDIGNMLVSKFNNSAVAKALRGQGSEDLPAHLGLSNSIANGLVDGMAGIIQTSVIISGKAIGSVMSIRIQAVKNDWDEYLNLPGAQYTSQPSNITIPVARWLLVDPSIDIGQAAYDIVFRGDDKKFDVQIQKKSRSGRAIMVSLKTLGGGGGYVLPSIISGQAGENFIEYTLGQQGVAMMAATTLMKRVR